MIRLLTSLGPTILCLLVPFGSVAASIAAGGTSVVPLGQLLRRLVSLDKLLRRLVPLGQLLRRLVPLG